MLIMPGFGDRMVVLAVGLLMCAGGAYFVNRMRAGSDRTRGS